MYLLLVFEADFPNETAFYLKVASAADWAKIPEFFLPNHLSKVDFTEESITIKNDTDFSGIFTVYSEMGSFLGYLICPNADESKLFVFLQMKSIDHPNMQILAEFTEGHEKSLENSPLYKVIKNFAK